jgi:anhydro-N-acetylmuramic acid kinase
VTHETCNPRAAAGKLANMSDASRLIVGAMSGTSADGVDAALVRVEGRGIGMKATLLGHAHESYTAELRAAIFAARTSGTHGQQVMLASLARMARDVALAYAAAVQKLLALTGVHANDVAAVAAHGQTLFHEPPNTIQWVDPALLAAEVGCAVVRDFRRADLAAGGQGAPLVPFADYVLFRHPTKNRVMLNLGGIANITWLRAGGTPRDVIAFDTGPANCVVDELLKPHIDTGGERALRGRVHEQMVVEVLSAPYFDHTPPKSTDGPEMVATFHAAHQNHPNVTQLEDLLATACAVTATSISRAIERWCPCRPDELIASGGGTKNAALMSKLRERLAGASVCTLDEVGMSTDAKEAVAFALLAAATLDGEPSNIPAATGAGHAVILGSVTPKPW